jgi:hypothetical protein
MKTNNAQDYMMYMGVGGGGGIKKKVLTVND